MKTDNKQKILNSQDSRRLTFEEFLWLYVHSNESIPDIINGFCPNDWSSMRIAPEFFTKLSGMGLGRGEIFAFAKMSEEAAPTYTGQVITFVPRGKEEPSSRIPYFLISHPFETTTIREKLSQRELHFAYDGYLATSLVKTLCLAHPDGSYILAALLNETNADWKKLGIAIGLSSNKSKRLRQYDGSLEEAVGMPAGKVGPLVTAEHLPSLSYIVIDSMVETPQEGERSLYLEIPLNIGMAGLSLIEILRDSPIGEGKREISVAYNPSSNSLADALKKCYGEKKVVVADMVK